VQIATSVVLESTYTTGKWADFATNDKGGDLISLWAYVKGVNNAQAAKELIEFLGV
jgi:putative DNA primase/helicase